MQFNNQISFELDNFETWVICKNDNRWSIYTLFQILLPA